MAEAYDVIVVGAGLGGLSCAALLSRAGKRVLVLEKNHRPGGYGITLTCQGHRVDIASQSLGGCHPEGYIGRVLAAVGQAHRVRFLPCEPARYYIFADGQTYAQAGSIEAQARALRHDAPDQIQAIDEYFRVLTGLARELDTLSTRQGEALFGFSANYPLLARYGQHTLAQFLDELAVPEALRRRLAARTGYCMLPPGRLSLVAFACQEASFGQGAWLVEGGVEHLALALAEAVTAAGGRVQCHAKVETVLTEAGRVAGVACKESRSLADRVVLAAKGGEFLTSRLDRPELLPASYRRRLTRLETSGSYHIRCYRVPEAATEGLYPNVEVKLGRDWPEAFYMLIPSLVDKSLSPPGYHSLWLSIPVPPGTDLTEAVAATVGRRIEAEACRHFPALAGRLEPLFELSPRHLQAMTGNPGGAAYGWALTPSQAGLARLGVKTPIPGLFLTGHWTMPGGGIAAVVASGELCAARVLGKEKMPPAAGGDHPPRTP
jgi:all-trans-retinol 13,14-reductase